MRSFRPFRTHRIPLVPRPRRMLSGTAIATVAVAMSASATFAADFGTIETSPSPAEAGAVVNLNSDACGENAAATVEAGSMGVQKVKLSSRGEARAGTVRGELNIPRNTMPGKYGIGGTCDNGRQITGIVEVVAAGKQPDRPDDARQPASQDRNQDKGQNRDQDQEGRDHGESAPRNRDEARDQGQNRNQDRGPDQARDHGEKAPRAGHRGHDGRQQDARHRTTREHDPRRHGPREPAPHGKVRAGLGGGSEGVSTAQLAGGSAALAVAAGGVLYLHRRHRTHRH